MQRESRYHPWQATAYLSYFSYRFELEWKDRVYCDVSFSEIDDKSGLIKAEFEFKGNSSFLQIIKKICSHVNMP
jgi:hypothetical protein